MEVKNLAVAREMVKSMAVEAQVIITNSDHSLDGGLKIFKKYI